MMKLTVRCAYFGCLILVTAAVVSAEAPKSPGKQGPYADILPPGMRAYDFRAGTAKTFDGFILPGSRVDLVGVQRTTPEKTVAKTVLENVLVLAIDVAGPGDKPELSEIT